MSNKRKKIYKASGKYVLFSKKKLITSLLRSGAPRKLALAVADEVAREIHSGMSTRDVYRKAFALLKKKKEMPVAARYNLKQAIQELGPSGFPFEKFIGELFRKKGFKTKVGQSLKGRCVPHEVDVVIESPEKVRFVECKFRNYPAAQVDVKVPLYIQSRFIDLEANLAKPGIRYEPWIITNTKFSKDAIAYGKCMKMKLIGWRYPKDFGLEHLVEDLQLHPVTCLTSLNKGQKQRLLKEGIVLCQDILAKSYHLDSLGVNKARVLREVKSLCQNH